MKKYLVALIVIGFLSSAPVLAQPTEEWVARHDGDASGYDQVAAIALDDNGNIYVTGRSMYPGESYDIVTIKYDPDGNEVWLARYSGPPGSMDMAADIYVDADFNVYVTGGLYPDPWSGNWITIKYNPDGTEAWSQVYSGGGGSAIVVDGDGNVIVTGSSATDIATIKYNSGGTQQWVSFYDGPISGNDTGADVTVDGDGNVYVTGSIDAGQYNPDYATIQYAPDGTQNWATTFDAAGYPDTPNAILLDAAGNNVYVAGSSALTTDTNSDLHLIKYTLLGVYVWDSRYDGGSSDFGNIIAQDPGGNIFVAGSSMMSGGSGHYDYTTVKFNSGGTQLWTRHYDGPADYKWDEARGIAVDSDGNAYVGGYSQGDAVDNNRDYATVAYDPDGTQLWVMRYDGPANGEDYGNGGVAVDANFNVYVTGKSRGIGTSDDYTTIKYSPGAEPVPTLSEWGMIILALLVMTFGTVAIIRKREPIAVETK